MHLSCIFRKNKLHCTFLLDFFNWTRNTLKVTILIELAFTIIAFLSCQKVNQDCSCSGSFRLAKRKKKYINSIEICLQEYISIETTPIHIFIYTKAFLCFESLFDYQVQKRTKKKIRMKMHPT